jgi:tRNA threonylcarbamoyladenosine biosynthesis protein TsaB
MIHQEKHGDYLNYIVMHHNNLVLGIETSGLMCSVAWMQNGQILLETNIEQANKHAEILPELIANGFKYLKIKRKEIGLVSVAAGPGSFTGLRIGMAYAKGFCNALQKPLVAVSNFRVLAWITRGTVHRIVVLIDARRGRAYRAIIENGKSQSEQIDIISLAQLNNDLTDDTIIIKEKHLAISEQIRFKNPVLSTQITAGEVCHVGHDHFLRHGSEPLENIEPAYFQQFAGMG